MPEQRPGAVHIDRKAFLEREFVNLFGAPKNRPPRRPLARRPGRPDAARPPHGVYICEDGSEADCNTVINLQPGDEVRLRGAVVTVPANGRPEVAFKPGFENRGAEAAKGPIIVPGHGPSNAALDDNIRTAQAKAKIPFASALWFARQVTDKGPWDYKEQGTRYEPYGNFHYGATGRAVGVSAPRLLQEAGINQVKKETEDAWGRPGVRPFPRTGTGSFGDEPVDQFWITNGSRYYDSRYRK